MPTRTIAYLRVSTEKQADKGVSLDAQRAKVKAYAELYDLELAEVIVDAGESVKPNGPPGERVVVKPSRAGVPTKYRQKTCPGTGGNPCVRGGAWLRDKLASSVGVCLACIDRAMVWNGNVPATEVRAHLLALRRKGIGYKTVADACDVSHSLLGEILSGRATHLRSQSARRVLAVDEGCRADGCRVSAAATRKLVSKILARGFTQTWLSRQLGCSVYVFSKNAWAEKGSVLAATALKVEKIWRRVKAGELEPRPRWVKAAPTLARIRRLLGEGFTMKSLGERLNYPIAARTLLLQRVRPETAEKVEAFYREITAESKAGRADLFEPVADDGWKRRLISAYLDGVPVNDLAARFGKEPSNVSQILHRAGVARPKTDDEGAAA